MEPRTKRSASILAGKPFSNAESVSCIRGDSKVAAWSAAFKDSFAALDGAP